MAGHNYFSNLTWQIADLLRGPQRPAQCERVMPAVRVPRRFGCVPAPAKTKVRGECARLEKLEGEALDAKRTKAAGDQRFHNRSALYFLRRAPSKTDAVGKVTEHTIALVKERRSALIADALTGQIAISPEAAG